MKLGIDCLEEVGVDNILKGRNFALITGSSNVDGEGRPVYRMMKLLAPGGMKSIWSLQHGFFIDKQDNMILSDSFQWEAMGIEVKSLYGEKLLPPVEWLEGIDALVVDIFDVGTRVYTFVNHVLMIMRELSGRGIDIIVLDRPNPLGGVALEGNVMEEEYFSIVGRLPVPMRHGLTVGEFLSYGLSYYQIDLNLEVVQVRGWERGEGFSGLWTYPSPNMPAYSTAVVYPGAVMLEGVNLSEGRGTARPFEMVGAPFIDNFRLVRELERLDFPGAVFVPTFFKPEFSKFAGEVCKGVLVGPFGGDVFRSFAVYYELMRLVLGWYPGEFKWKEPPYEFEYERLPIDMICGCDWVREGVEGNIPFRELEERVSRGVEEYFERVSDLLLY